MIRKQCLDKKFIVCEANTTLRNVLKTRTLHREEGTFKVIFEAVKESNSNSSATDLSKTNNC